MRCLCLRKINAWIYMLGCHYWKKIEVSVNSSGVIEAITIKLKRKKLKMMKSQPKKSKQDLMDRENPWMTLWWKVMDRMIMLNKNMGLLISLILHKLLLWIVTWRRIMISNLRLKKEAWIPDNLKLSKESFFKEMVRIQFIRNLIKIHTKCEDTSEMLKKIYPVATVVTPCSGCNLN